MDPQDSPSISPWAWGFRPGGRVRIVGGTFAGMAGQLLSYEQAQEWRQRNGQPRCRRVNSSVWVLIELFGRPVPVDLLADQIEST